MCACVFVCVCGETRACECVESAFNYGDGDIRKMNNDDDDGDSESEE